MTFSEPISWLEQLTDTLLVLPECQGEPVGLVLSQPPLVLSQEPYQVQFLVEKVPDGFSSQQRYCVVQPFVPKGNIVNVSLFNAVAGLDINAPRSLNAIGIIDPNGMLVPMHAELQNSSQGDYFERNWVPPRFFRDGKVLTHLTNQCSPTDVENRSLESYPDGCLASLKVVSKGAYTAKVQIYDNFGRFLHGSVQRFGQCGELNNPERESDSGTMSWVVWNMTDQQSVPVTNGVYIWKVLFVSETDNEQFTAVFKQGIVRNTTAECSESL